MALRPDDHKAQTNLAYAEVVSGDVEGGRKRVRAVLEQHPDHASAASLIIQSYAQDASITDPLTLVPEASHNTVEVKVARIIFLRAHDDRQWEALAQSGAKEHPDNRHLVERLAAEAVLEPALADIEIVFGKPASKELYDAVRKSAETLERLWSRRWMRKTRTRKRPIRWQITLQLRSALSATQNVLRAYSMTPSRRSVAI